MGLDIENGALGAEYEQNDFCRFFLQNITDWYNWIQHITKVRLRRGRWNLDAAALRTTSASVVAKTFAELQAAVRHLWFLRPGEDSVLHYTLMLHHVWLITKHDYWNAVKDGNVLGEQNPCDHIPSLYFIFISSAASVEGRASCERCERQRDMTTVYCDRESARGGALDTVF